MSRLADPSLSLYNSIIHSLLQFSGLPLSSLESSPPENIFPICYQIPSELKRNRHPHELTAHELISDQNANIRSAFYLVLHRCFTEAGTKALNDLLAVVLDPGFRINFPEVNFETDPVLFNDIEFKKLFAQFLTLADTSRTPLEHIINKYPIVDIVLIYILRSILNRRMTLGAEERVDTGELLKIVAQVLGLRVSNESNGLYTFENNSYLLDADKIYIAYPAGETDLDVSRVPSENTFINGIGEYGKESTLRKSHAASIDDSLRMKQNEFFLHNPLDVLITKNLAKAIASEIFPSGRAPRLSTETMDRFREERYRDEKYRDERFGDSAAQRSNVFIEMEEVAPKHVSFSTPRRPVSGDVKDELRKSQLRVSGIRHKEDGKNKRVSTADIFDNEQYFTGKPSTAAYFSKTPSETVGRGRPSDASGTLPFEEIMKRNPVTEPNTSMASMSSSRDMNYPEYSSASKLSSPPASIYFAKEATSSYNFYTPSAPSTPMAPTAPVASHPSASYPPESQSSFSSRSVHPYFQNAMDTYYSDFTNSYILEQLPPQNKDNIREIKRSLKGDSSQHHDIE